MSVDYYQQAGKAIMDAYRTENAATPVTKFYGTAANGYRVETDGLYQGFVSRTTDRQGWHAWYLGNIVTDVKGEAITYRTRKDAVAALGPVATVERAARIHWRNATSDDRAVSAGDSPVYLASKAVLLTSIAHVYADMDAEAIYYAWTEHGETILQTVTFDRRDAIEQARLQAEMAAEDARYAAEQAAQNPAEARRAQAIQTLNDVAARGTGDPATWLDADRSATFYVGPGEGGQTVITFGFVSPDIEPDKAHGRTAQGVPFSVGAVRYDSAQTAWSMVDTIATELRHDANAWQIKIYGQQPHNGYRGTVYAGSTACCHDQALYPSASVS